MVVRNREARTRQAWPSAPRSGRNGAKRRENPLGLHAKAGHDVSCAALDCELPLRRCRQSAAFVAPAAAFAVNRQVANRPPGRISVAVSLKRVRRAPGLQPPTTSRGEPARFRGAAAVDGEGRGGVSRAPLVPFLARSMRVWNGGRAL